MLKRDDDRKHFQLSVQDLRVRVYHLIKIHFFLNNEYTL